MNVCSFKTATTEPILWRRRRGERGGEGEEERECKGKIQWAVLATSLRPSPCYSFTIMHRSGWVFFSLLLLCTIECKWKSERVTWGRSGNDWSLPYFNQVLHLVVIRQVLKIRIILGQSSIYSYSYSCVYLAVYICLAWAIITVYITFGFSASHMSLVDLVTFLCWKYCCHNHTTLPNWLTSSAWSYFLMPLALTLLQYIDTYILQSTLIASLPGPPQWSGTG